MANDPLQELRVCSKCSVEKPLEEDYFLTYPFKGTRRHRLSCRSCLGMSEGPNRHKKRKLTAEQKANYHKDNYHKRKAENPEILRGYWKVATEKNRDKRNARARERWANASREYKDANNRKSQEWRKLNAARNKEYNREYQKQWCAKNPEKCREKVRKWVKANPLAATQSYRKRRALLAKAEGSHTAKDIKRLKAAQNDLCFYCHEKLTKFHADHFIPLSKGGSDYPSNLRISCPTCNCKKHTKLPWEWMPERFSPPN